MRGDRPVAHARAARARGTTPTGCATLPALDARGARSRGRRLGRVLDAWRASLGFDGLNLTHPCKQAVRPLLDERARDDVDAPRCRQHGGVSARRRDGTQHDWSGFASRPRTRAARCAPLDTRSCCSVREVRGSRSPTRWCAVAWAMVLMTHDERRGRDALRAPLRAARRPRRRRALSTSDRATMSGADGLVHATPTGMRRAPRVAGAPSRCSSSGCGSRTSCTGPGDRAACAPPGPGARVSTAAAWREAGVDAFETLHRGRARRGPDARALPRWSPTVPERMWKEPVTSRRRHRLPSGLLEDKLSRPPRAG